ncbi:malto-oligosyltrehalose trehalohydrolase [Kribbella deserti]|uniref:Malto-oligosyltrehalose trehalohydrolase n=1 Tax=Kribbella deserti TaxID=1926257 RepID=A0ABV6QS66_9ACTN
MHTFTVWAPTAKQVELVLREGDRPMQAAENGWWSLEVAEAGHGTDYAFKVDGGEPTPDPRSAWQPAGVHGWSRVHNSARFSWSDQDWRGKDVRGSVLYELHPGTFTAEGTFDAAIEHLPYLVDLGIDVVSLLPVAAFSGRHGWGYDGVHLYAVHEPYGGPDALQRFVDRCHALGLGVGLDVVYNHLGPSGNYLDRFGPYFTERHSTPWGPAVNLDDEGSDEVREWIIGNALRWFRDFHLDALRLDAVHALVDESPRHLLAELSDRTAELAGQLGRPLGLIAESDLNDPRMIEPVDQGGLGMTAQWSDDFHHSLRTLLTGDRSGYYGDFGSPEVLAKTLTRVFLHDGGYSSFRGKDWGRPVDPERHRGHSFLAYASNHDQVGNRALGDRLPLTEGQLAIAATFVLTGPFTPMIFMGEEWAASTPWRYFTDHDEPALAEAVRDGRRREFASHGWNAEDIPDPQDPATREASVLDWTELATAPHNHLLSWYRDLIALRRSEPDLTDDRLSAVQVQHDADGAWSVVARGNLRVVVNLGTETRSVPVDTHPRAIEVAFGPAVLEAESVHLPGHCVAVVRV